VDDRFSSEFHLYYNLSTRNKNEIFDTKQQAFSATQF